MFLSAINWRHIIGALVTGVILQIAGILNFWIFLGLVALAITIALAQYLPVAKRTATVMLLAGGAIAIGIPAIHGYMERQWPSTYESLQERGVAADLKGAEILNQPGLKGVAGQRKLAEKKEEKLTANAQAHFDEAARLYNKNQFTSAAEEEKQGRAVLELVIAERKADAEYIKDKLSTVKVPAGLWQKTKDFFASINFGALTEILQKGFALRLLVLGAIIMGLGLLLLRKFPKSKLIGLVTVLGGAAILWSLFLFFTPEIAPAPPGGAPVQQYAADKTGGTFQVPPGQIIHTGIFVNAGQSAHFSQPCARLFYLKGTQYDVPVRSKKWSDKWNSPGQIGLRGGPVATTVTVTLN